MSQLGALLEAWNRSLLHDSPSQWWAWRTVVQRNPPTASGGVPRCALHMHRKMARRENTHTHCSASGFQIRYLEWDRWKIKISGEEEVILEKWTESVKFSYSMLTCLREHSQQRNTLWSIKQQDSVYRYWPASALSHPGSDSWAEQL